MAPGRKARPARPTLEEVETRIGHAFADRALLQRALTHPSAALGDRRVTSYQRLEFLGDRVLGLLIADTLYRAMPLEDEGGLSRRLSDLVRAETCAAIAADLGLGQAIAVGRSESQTGVGNRAGVLADLAEAVIGAVYLDGGFDAARALVDRLYRTRLAEPPPRERDAKSVLQEWAQGRGLATPVYRLKERSGPDHQPHFVMAVQIPGLADGEGEGASKRHAEAAAAESVLVREGVWTAGEAKG